MAEKPLNEEDRPEEHHYSFFDDFEDAEGIFANRADPYGSYGDPAAIEDAEAERTVAPITMINQLDGLPAPVPDFDGMKVLTAPSRVSMEEMVCLAGPCKHYIENIVQMGTLPDGKPFTVLKRYCSRLRTWAELMALDDVDIEACSGHEIEKLDRIAPEVVSRVSRNFNAINALNAKAMATEGHDLGICYRGMCRHYLVLIIKTLDVEGNLVSDKKRFCAALAGAARPRTLLSYQPVLGCSKLTSTLPDGAQLWRALSRNQDVIDAHRQRDAARRGTAPRGDRGHSDGHCCGTGECACGQSEGSRPACAGGDVPPLGEGGDVRKEAE